MQRLLGKARAFSGIATDDIDAARAFDGQTLGLDVEDENGMLWLRLAEGRDMLVYPKPDHVPTDYAVLNFRAWFEDPAGTSSRSSGSGHDRVL